jgi:hypothetical protein
MEPIWEQDKDAGYDFSDEAFTADNAYYSTYGGNACIVCMGGSYVRNVNIKTASMPSTTSKAVSSVYSKYDGGNADDYYEDDEDHEVYYDEDNEVYDDDTNDF